MDVFDHFLDVLGWRGCECGDGDRDDMRTVHGLDDDLDVVNYACRVLDRQDLVIDTGPARLLVV